MKRHAHMVDLLRETLTFEEQLEMFQHKHELTVEDFETILEKARMIKKAAKIAKQTRYGK